MSSSSPENLQDPLQASILKHPNLSLMVFVTFYPSDLDTTGLPMGIGTREAGWKRSGAKATGSEKDERKATDFSTVALSGGRHA